MVYLGYSVQETERMIAGSLAMRLRLVYILPEASHHGFFDVYIHRAGMRLDEIGWVFWSLRSCENCLYKV